MFSLRHNPAKLWFIALREEISTNLGRNTKECQHSSHLREDYEAALRGIVDDLLATWHNAWHLPLFLLIHTDSSYQWSYLTSILKFRGCELLINFMYRYIGMAFSRPAASEQHGCSSLGVTIGVNYLELIDYEDRRNEIDCSLFSSAAEQKYRNAYEHDRDANKALKIRPVAREQPSKGTEFDEGFDVGSKSRWKFHCL